MQLRSVPRRAPHVPYSIHTHLSRPNRQTPQGLRPLQHPARALSGTSTTLELAQGLLDACQSQPGLVAASLLAGYTVWTCMQPVLAWSLRTVPGKRGAPVIGDLPRLQKAGDFHVFLMELVKEHKDKLAHQFWLGTQPLVVVTDLKQSRCLMARLMARNNMDMFNMRFGRDKDIWYSGLGWLGPGPKFRIARKAFEAAVMNPRALAAQAPFICMVLSRSVSRLDALADSGQPVDMLAAMYDCTMDAVGYAAFGIDLHATSRSPSSSGVAYEEGWWTKYPVGSQEFGALMLQCAVAVMTMQQERASAYVLPKLLLPGFIPVVNLLAQLFPDKRLQHLNQMFRGLRESIKVLVDTWRAQQQAPAAARTATTSTTAAGTSSGNAGLTTTPVVSEQGFLARLLSGKDLAAGEKLEDYEVIGNAIQMITGGYETTGTAVANTLYLLAKHPEAQQRVQAELEAVLRGKSPQYEDLERLPYVSAVFAEALRVLPPVGSSMRRAAHEPVDLGQGVIVPKGAAVVLPTMSFMHDPDIWPRAEEFLPERHIQPGNEALAPSNPNAFMPFGHGPRMCVGYKYAQMEGRLALAHLLQRFSFETVPGMPEPVWKTAIVYSPPSLPLLVRRRA